MSNPTLYRKKSLNDARNRTLASITSSEKTQVSNAINKFFELFALKHL